MGNSEGKLVLTDQAVSDIAQSSGLNRSQVMQYIHEVWERGPKKITFLVVFYDKGVRRPPPPLSSPVDN